MATKITRSRESSAKNRQIASASVIVLYSIIFFSMYKIHLAMTEAQPREAIIEITPTPEMRRIIPQGVVRPNPQQKPVPNPPIINDPGKSAPQSAVVAKSNQSTKPQPKPETKPAELPEDGDVETKKPEQKIDQRSLFQSKAKGEEEENNPIGPDHRQPVTANLTGRSVVGSLPLPAYNSQNEGKVVVEITVDQNGNVTKASAISRGTTVSDQKLWRAAEEAAKKARFNVKQDAPIYQTGTITYVFKLN